MSVPIELLCDERRSGERLAVRWAESTDGYHHLEIVVERRERGEWRRAYGISVDPGEVFRLHDAIGMATWHARQVRR